MYVKSIDLRNFRNYEELSLTLSPGINIFYGSNAQGKTNILESVYMAATTRSHRGSKDRDMIRLGEEESHIRMWTERGGNENRIDIHLKKMRAKGVALNGFPVRRAADLYGITPLVFFSPEDLRIVKNGPSERRRFMDLVMGSMDRVYLADLSRYVKILKERNALLHEAAVNNGRRDEIDIWDMQLLDTGRRIIRKRREFLEIFSEKAALEHSKLTDGEENLVISYEPNVSEEDFEDKLRRNRESDLRTRETHAGPHRDDLSLMTGDMDLRVYGSQGQHRTAALSMKLAEIAYIGETEGVKPILLLDDVLSELDTKRQNALLAGIDSTQTLITCTGMDDLLGRAISADRIYEVVRGTVREISRG
ncbi:MAG: DNA replication/repair protein RecF [Lachnospiraceae bacterium]|nr:DNA replication/repair protein RecF [Lachnospiraceae bacterium]